MRRSLFLLFLALALVACTKVGPAPPDFYATLEAIRVELTEMAPAPLAVATTTPEPVMEASATPTDVPPATPTETPTPPPEATPGPDAEPAETLPPAPDVAPTPTPVLYTVQRGDHLSVIAARYGVTVQALAEANDIANPNLIEVGQALVIPAP